ncbi:hypothetical protein [Methylosinus sp. PW1]|uniref:hypothetical protein n=1 Tax=Methylosinus sp. PW1 TaxID=107636 RepID=UPI000560B5BD|nr:hypothetical protein [Methylosinus sp. PW1]
MAKRPNSPTATDAQVLALLDRYQCPVPFHEVRARLLGNIASPSSRSPIETVKSLWGGELPPFDSIDEANELIGALVMGLWNRLTRHQERSDPFRLKRVQSRANREEIMSLATMRRQELDGFAEGLFGGAEELDLSERAVDAMTVLSTLRAMFVAIEEVTGDPTKAANEKDFAETLDRMREMTLTAEKSIHAVVLACKRARASDSAGLAKRSTLH